MTDLEARLVLANDERTDVLEGFHEACETVRKLTERERIMTREVEELRNRLLYSNGRYASDTTLALPNTNSLMRPKHMRTTSDVRGLAPGNDPLMEQLRGFKELATTQDAKIRQLELEASSPPQRNTAVADSTESGKEHLQCIADLEARLGAQQQMLETAQADCERYNSLLHNELRRQSRFAAQQTRNVTPKIET